MLLALAHDFYSKFIFNEKKYIEIKQYVNVIFEGAKNIIKDICEIKLNLYFP
jgi:hypothetical protein